jgi:glycerol-3-phosphate dehydrogenase
VRLFEQVRQAPELARRIVPQAPFCLAEAVHAVREEMATTLEDVLRRRIPLALLCRLADEDLQEVSRLVAGELGWTDERRDREVEHLTSKW